MKKVEKYKSEFLITTDCGFQYVVNDDLRNIINDGDLEPTELVRWQHTLDKDIVIEIRAENKDSDEIKVTLTKDEIEQLIDLNDKYNPNSKLYIKLTDILKKYEKKKIQK